MTWMEDAFVIARNAIVMGVAMNAFLNRVHNALRKNMVPRAVAASQNILMLISTGINFATNMTNVQFTEEKWLIGWSVLCATNQHRVVQNAMN